MKFNIPEDKEQKIYIAALNEFSKNGYDKGSTNTIVKEASISKGALFNYFGSKANLFIYVVDRAIKELDNNIFNNAQKLSPDMFERIVELTKIKVEVSLRYTKESAILVESMRVEEAEIKRFINEKIEYYYLKMQKIFTDGIDFSKFREGINPEKVYEILTFISDGLQKKYMKQYKGSFELMAKNIDEMSEDTFSYIEFLRSSVYK